ncbi:MAG TPA: hypothetical protein VHP11_08950, partial [Tepidisphaeraceae bacterium]|nr:hypothetical protein [Tepidisphaeraceae bacterium]
MTTTVLLMAAFLSISVELLLHALLLKAGAHWVKIPAVTFRRALLTIVLCELAIAAVFALTAIVPTDTPLHQITIALVGLALRLIVIWCIIAAMLKTPFARAILAWLPTLLASAASVLVAIFIVRPYLCEAHLILTNSMAPTLVGHHLQKSCPRCGSPAIVPWYPEPPMSSSGTVTAICTREYQSCVVTTPPNDRPLPADRILAIKLLRPRRWDIVVFRKP